MPIPTPADFRDRTKKHSEVREMMAQMAENVAPIQKVDLKQKHISADTAELIDFSTYLQVGNLNAATGLLENSQYTNRRSIVDFPVVQGVTYRIQNTADVVSSLRVAFFDANQNLLSVITKTAGQMVDWIFTAPANAAKANITLKSGNTDSIAYDASLVRFYSSASGVFELSKVNNFSLRDDRVPGLQANLSSVAGKTNTLEKEIFKSEQYNDWLEFGLDSAGGLNTVNTQSHLEYISVQDGDVLSSDKPMYRINLYKADKSFISQGGFTGGSSFTIPSGLNVVFVRISKTESHTTNTTVVTVTSPVSEIIKMKATVAENANTVALNKVAIQQKQDIIKPATASLIDFTAYLKVGNINASTGLLENTGSKNRRSIVDFPVVQGFTYRIQNTADLLSNLRIGWFDSNGTLLSVTNRPAGQMADWIFTAPANAVKANITLKSGNTDSVVFDSGLVKFFSSTNGDFKLTHINGFELAGAGGGDTATDPDAVKNVVVGGIYANKDGNGVVVIGDATAQRSGLMSPVDKAKLDALINGIITINGSGVTKNAASFGFLPNNNADDNVVALKAAVAGGGTILIDYPGVYDINQTIPLESNTLILFGAKVYINKVLFSGKSPKYTFINEGAYRKQWNENIILRGMKMICNGIGNGTDGTAGIPGLRGHIAMHYIRNFHLDDFELLDGDAQSYVVHVCTFENIKITSPHIEGYKDAIHLGNGDCYLIRDGRFKTYDDPIALNCHDYATGQPELGSLTNGLIENCYDLADPDRGTTGYFARILAGAWIDWKSGMTVQQSDTVVASNGKMYRVSNGVTDPVTYYTSLTEPSHATGTATIDGIKWTMIQDQNVGHSVGVRGLTFRNIYLQKPRPIGISIHFDKDRHSRSYYPNSEIPDQDGIVFDGLYQQADIPTLISAVTPLKTVKIINSEIGDTRINLTNINTDGMTYEPVNVLMMGNTFKGKLAGQPLISTAAGRTAKVKILGSIKENDSYNPTFGSGVTVISSDL